MRRALSPLPPPFSVGRQASSHRPLRPCNLTCSTHSTSSVPTARGGEAGQRTTFRIPSRCRGTGVLSPSCSAGAGCSCGLGVRKRRCEWSPRCTRGVSVFCSQGGAPGVRRNRFQWPIAIEYCGYDDALYHILAHIFYTGQNTGYCKMGCTRIILIVQ